MNAKSILPSYFRKQLNLYRRKLRAVRINCHPSEFFQLLNHQSVEYVLLRSSSGLVNSSSDIDLLVSRDDLYKVSPYLTKNPLLAHNRIDVFSDFGHHEACLWDTAYFPPAFARSILTDYHLSPESIRVPSRVHSLDSLVYHYFFRKVYQSSLADKYIQRLPSSYASYPRSQLLPALYSHLYQKELLPPIDMIQKMAPYSEMASLLNSYISPTDYLPSTLLSCFVIRNSSCMYEVLLHLQSLISSTSSLSIILTHILTNSEIQSFSSKFRGGNWLKLTPFDGSVPYALIFVSEKSPSLPLLATRTNHPFAQSDTIIRIKNTIRERFYGNVIHSTDSHSEAIQLASFLSLSIPFSSDSPYPACFTDLYNRAS